MVKRHEDELHPAIPKLIEDLEQHKISRREFLRFATLLGVSAVTAYGLAGLTAPRKAMGAMPKGGTVRISMRVMENGYLIPTSAARLSSISPRPAMTTLPSRTCSKSGRPATISRPGTYMCARALNGIAADLSGRTM